MSTIKLKTINTEDLEKETDVIILYNKGMDLVITNQEQYEAAADVLKDVKTRYKELDEQRKSITKPIDEAKKRIMDVFNKPLDFLSKAEKKIKSLLIGWDDEQERIAKENQDKLQKLADQDAEKQKKLIDAKIERAEIAGKVDKVEELLLQKETIIPIAAPVISKTIETPKGISYKINWSAEVINEALVPREYLSVNIQALNKVAQATKGTLTIPGVKFVSNKVAAGRM